MIATNVISAPARISAVGMFAPERILDNAYFEKLVDTNDEWIVQRTGIRTRHVVEDGQYASHLAIAAIDDLLANNPSVNLADVDYIIVGSTTPDYEYPSFPRCCRRTTVCRKRSARSTSRRRARRLRTASTWRAD